MRLKHWHKTGTHIWYFLYSDQIVTVDNNQHWFWFEFCTGTPTAVYLGEL